VVLSTKDESKSLFEQGIRIIQLFNGCVILSECLRFLGTLICDEYRKAFALIVFKGSHDREEKHFWMRMPTGNTHHSTLAYARSPMWKKRVEMTRMPTVCFSCLSSSAYRMQRCSFAGGEDGKMQMIPDLAEKCY
jgi:hypothetical protein